MTTSDPLVCATCDQTHPHPNGFMPKHLFNDGSLPASSTFGKRRVDGSRGPAPTAQKGSEGPVQVSAVRAPFDPVLRLALINRGVITPDDLRQAEEQILVVTGEVMSDGLRQGRQEGLRLQEQAEGLQEAPSEGREQGEGGTNRQRRTDARSPVPDGEEGRTDPQEAPEGMTS